MRLPFRLLLLLFCLPQLGFGQIITYPGRDTTICSGNLSFRLRATPSGGTWSGPAGFITPDGVFDPQAGAPPITVTYTLRDGSSASRTISTTLGPPANAGKDTVICSSTDVVQAIGTPAQPGYTYHWSQLAGRFTANGIANPNVAQPTVNLINNTREPLIVTYYLAVTLAGTPPCTSWDSVRVTVFPKTTGAIRPPFTDTTICAYAAPFVLRSGSPPAAQWIGTGIPPSQSYPGVFNPNPAIEGVNVVTYHVPCNTPTQDVTVNITVKVPRSEAGPDKTYCVNVDSVKLDGFPAGGKWTGPGIKPNGVIRRPPRLFAANGGQHTYYYKVIVADLAAKNDTGCFAIDSMVVTFKDYPNVSPAANVTLCANDPSKELAGYAPQGSGGTFAITTPTYMRPLVQGSSIVPGANGQRYVGVGTLRYTYIDPTTGCSNFAESLVTINRVDTAHVGEDTSVCQNVRPFNLVGARPGGGTWEGSFRQCDAAAPGCGRIAPPQNPLQAGIYKYVYTIVNRNGCRSKDSLNIEFKVAPTNVIAAPDTQVCANSPAFNITRSSPAGGRYRNALGFDSIYGVDTLRGRFTPSRFLVGIQKIYYVVTSQQQCSARDSMLITVRPLPRANAGSDFSVCSMADSLRIGSDTLPQRPGQTYTYLWTGSQGTSGFSTTRRPNPLVVFTNNDADPVTNTYLLKVTESNVGFISCSNSDSLQVKVYPRPDAQVYTPNITRGCEGDTLTLRARTRAGVTYQWYTATTILTPIPNFTDTLLRVTQTGRYFLRLADTTRLRGSACTDTSTGDSLFIKLRVRPVVTGLIPFCGGPNGRTDSLHVSPALRPALTYQWLKDNVVIQNANDTVYKAKLVATYRVVVRDARFGITCSDTSAPLKVDSIPTPYNDLVKFGSDTTFTLCSTQLPYGLIGPIDTAYPTAFNYRWQDGSPNRTFTVDSAGTYTLEVYNQCGSVSDTVNLTEVIPSPIFTILGNGAKDTTVCTTVDFKLVGPPGVFWNWYIENGRPGYDTTAQVQMPPVDFVDPDTTADSVGHLIRLTVYNIYNARKCSYTDSIRYHVKFCDPVLYIPSAFTPQGDGINEKWVLQSYQIKTAKVAVYNRWGNQVYYAGTLDELKSRPWDGTFDGQACISGAYQYVAEYDGLASDHKTPYKLKKTGTVTIIR